DHESGRDFHSHHAFLLWFDETFFNRNGNRSNCAVSAHGKATACFDEQHSHIILRIMRRIQHASAHQVVPARLEHQSRANPVIFPKEVLALFTHGLSLQGRSSRPDEAERITAGMRIYTGKVMPHWFKGL